MSSENAEKNGDYFPPPESQGGWRVLADEGAVAATGGMDPAGLRQLRDFHLKSYGSHSWSIVVICRGWLVAEYCTFNVLKSTRFDIWSGTKSFTGTAWGLLLDDSRGSRTKRTLELDSPAYRYIPEGHPLTDERKKRISIRHLLCMTSGVPGNDATGGVAADPGSGEIEFALGLGPNRLGRMADRLAAEPGSAWDYSDAAFIHLALAFRNVAGRELSDYLRERVFDPTGIESVCWDVQGGSGKMGPHTNAHSGIHITARDLARFGYLMLSRGKWGAKQIVPEWWIDLCTKPSQSLNRHYGYTWWVNTEKGTRWDSSVPLDAFSLSGYRCNRCYIVPSLDLVAVRVGSGPEQWDEKEFVRQAVECARR